MSTKIYTKTGDKGTTSLIGGTKVPKSHLRIESYGTVDELNSFIGLLRDQLALAEVAIPECEEDPDPDQSHTAPYQPHTAFGQPHTAPDQQTALEKPQSAPGQPHIDPVTGQHHPTFGAIRKELLEIQDRLFTIGSSLACDPEKEPRLRMPDLKDEDIAALEKSIDQMDKVLPPMKSFVLPGGHIAVSTTHVVRCVCRRAERCCVRMQEKGLAVEPLVIRYLNRLSDYFFQAARYIAHLLTAPEIPWKPRIQ